MIEIETTAELEAHLQTGEALEGVVLQGLDLSAPSPALAGASLAGAVLLGCTLDDALRARAQDEGAVVFPALGDLPFQPYRGRLYDVEELYAGFDPARPETYCETLDARVYAHWERTGGARPSSLVETLARRLHDHAVTDALDELLATPRARHVVAIMGGHSMARGPDAYGRVARLARDLTRRGFFMASGGGPGAMEATHLGAWMAPRDDADLDAALALLAEAPTYRHPRWLAQAFVVRQRFPLADADRDAAASLGIPTWLYGHEPPGAFATHVAKYFANSVREEGLLTIATSGIVYSPGSAGTIQEIFQDACQNHYVTAGVVSPMVFLDVEYWTRTKPVYPLLETLSEGMDYGAWLAATDSLDDIVALLERYREEGPAVRA